MALAGYNEADTRAKLIDPALHVCRWIELVKDEHRATHGEIHREQSAVRIDILDGKPIKRGRGSMDYLLLYSTNGHQFVEYDTTTGRTTSARPTSDFPTPDALPDKRRATLATRVDVLPFAGTGAAMSNRRAPSVRRGALLLVQRSDTA